MMAALRPIRALVGPGYQMAQADWPDTKTALQSFCAPVGPDYLMVAGDEVS